MGAELTWLAVFVTLCACAEATSCPQVGDVGVARQPIVRGLPQSRSPSLDAAQQHAIVALTDSSSELLCTATLIRPSWALTAKHCGEASKLILGSWLSEPLVELEVAVRVEHPDADLMLLQLSPEAVDTLAAAVDVEPLVVLPQPVDQSWVGKTVELAGFGLTHTGDHGRLQFVAEPIVDAQAGMISVRGHGSGACNGDSGGPLLAETADGRAWLVGLLSSGSASCIERDHYLAVQPHLAWLRQVSGEALDVATPARGSRVPECDEVAEPLK